MPSDFPARALLGVCECDVGELTRPQDSIYSQMSDPPPIPPHQTRGFEEKKLGDDAGIRMLIPVGRTGWAIAAGYLGLFSLILLPAPISIIVSVIAILDIQRSKRTPNVKRGLGRAIFGLVMGIIFTIALAFVVIAIMSSD